MRRYRYLVSVGPSDGHGAVAATGTVLLQRDASHDDLILWQEASVWNSHRTCPSPTPTLR
jgi:hypothetical protein